MGSLPARDEIPATLLEYDQWVSWRSEERDGKPTKIPIDPETGEFASTTDPETWSSFETAREQVQFGTEDGVGFVFTDDDAIVGVDLDDCRGPEMGEVDDWAADVIERLDSYTEVSPSGTGFHVLVEGQLPAGRNRKGDLECYETARFFTVSGDHVDGTPTDLRGRSDALGAVHQEYIAADRDDSADSKSGRPEASTQADLADTELVERAKNAANGDKFARLWRGDTSGYESHSEADMALCSLLAFWSGGDPRQMDRLFRDSGLLREKWDEQHFADGSTYGEKTIERAIAGTTEFYEPGEAQSEPESTNADPDVDVEAIRSRTADRVARIEDLERRLHTVLQEKEELKAELEAERNRRRELEAQLRAQESEDDPLFGWF